jgi:hypothetical protein
MKRIDNECKKHGVILDSSGVCSGCDMISRCLGIANIKTFPGFSLEEMSVLILRLDLNRMTYSTAIKHRKLLKDRLNYSDEKKTMLSGGFRIFVVNQTTKSNHTSLSNLDTDSKIFLEHDRIDNWYEPHYIIKRVNFKQEVDSKNENILNFELFCDCHNPKQKHKYDVIIDNHKKKILFPLIKDYNITTKIVADCSDDVSVFTNNGSICENMSDIKTAFPKSSTADFAFVVCANINHETKEVLLKIKILQIELKGKKCLNGCKKQNN